MARRSIKAGWLICQQCHQQAAVRQSGYPLCADCYKAAQAASKAAAKVAWETAAEAA